MTNATSHVTPPATGGPSESTLSRIRGLLAQAENTPYAEEAEVFRGKAFELMARHAVDEALVTGPVEADEMGETSVDMSGAYGRARARLLGGIARAMNCYVLEWHRKRAQDPERCTVYGRRSDRERVELLYTSLLLQATNQVARVQPRNVIGATAADVRAARRAWYVGFASAVEERLTEKVTEAAAGTGAELVLADRSAAAESYARGLHAAVGKPRSSRVTDREALLAGVEAGRRADLGTSRLGGRPARQLR
ncbi:DUF2786 domain-containing protein [Pseudonocardia sp. NPDC049635]|uniref:DUF2786 domain-containing protein n=1 Tax=Pseudonocardia sp. NPDC049635 TaxID=3155506 RepID=UPI0033F20EE2